MIQKLDQLKNQQQQNPEVELEEQNTLELGDSQIMDTSVTRESAQEPFEIRESQVDYQANRGASQQK